MFESLRESVYWPDLYKDIKQFLRHVSNEPEGHNDRQITSNYNILTSVSL